MRGWLIAAALALGLPGAAASEDCAALHAAALGLAEKAGFRVVDAGSVTEGTPCAASGVVIEQEGDVGLRVYLGRAEWRAEGIEPGGPFGGAMALELGVTGLRYHTVTGMDEFDYMFDLQSRRMLIDGRLDIAWDPEAAVLDLRELWLDLPAANALSLSLRLSEVHLGTLILRGTSGFPVALDRLEMSVVNEGFFDNLYLGALVGALGSRPEAKIGRFKGTARGVLSGLPSAVVPPNAKAALRALIGDLPAPWGRIDLRVLAEAPVPLRRLALALREGRDDPAGLRAVLDGVSVEVEYVPWTGWRE